MSNTLLNTVGSHNKQFSAMTFPVQTPQKPAVQSAVISEKPHNETEKNDKTKKLLLGLGGLAVLGAASVIVYKKLKRGKMPTSGGSNTSTGYEPEAPIGQIKTKLKEEYLKSKENVIEAFNAELPEKLKIKENSIYKSSNDLRKLEQSLQSGEDFSVDKYEKMRDTASSAIKRRLVELQGDEDWHYLRAQRKVLVNQIEKAGDDSHIALQKMSLVNDLLVYKADPSKEQIFKNRNLMSPEDAISLVKRDFSSVEEFKAERQKLFKYDFNYDLGEDFTAGHFSLKVKDVFKTLKEKYDFAKKKLVEVMEIKKLIPNVLTSLKEKLNTLAQKFRKSELIQKLHNNTRQPV